METPNQHNVIRRTVESFQPGPSLPQPDQACEIAESRTLSVARAIVLKAFADHELVDQWWGPQGFRTHTLHLDFRPGGVWQHRMKGPDRDEATHYVKYLQTGPETIDFVHGVDESTVDYRGIVTLKELGTENTELNFRMVFDSPQTKADNHGAPQGLANTLSRLEALLTDPTATDKESM